MLKSFNDQCLLLILPIVIYLILKFVDNIFLLVILIRLTTQDFHFLLVLFIAFIVDTFLCVPFRVLLFLVYAKQSCTRLLSTEHLCQLASTAYLLRR